MHLLRRRTYKTKRPCRCQFMPKTAAEMVMLMYEYAPCYTTLRLSSLSNSVIMKLRNTTVDWNGLAMACKLLQTPDSTRKSRNIPAAMYSHQDPGVNAFNGNEQRQHVCACRSKRFSEQAGTSSHYSLSLSCSKHLV